MEDPWLILAAIASPRASLDYIQTALKITPGSPRARKGMQWAMQRLQEEGEAQPAPAAAQPSIASRLPAAGSQPAPVIESRAAPRPRSRLIVPALLVGIGLIVCIGAAMSGAMKPVLASIVQQAAATEAPSWASVNIPKPTYAPDTSLAAEIQPTAIIEVTSTPAEDLGAATALPTEQPTDSVAESPTESPTEQPTQEPPTAEPTYSGSLTLTYVDDTPTVPAPAGEPGSSPSAGNWIDVNLSQQMVYAYAGDQLMNSFVVSTGTWLHPTVTGKYHIYVKLRYTDMSGPDYYLPNVPYTMYFFRGYALHGTYWHHNFGTPMSHGCVNLSIPDSQWLYNFASVGTLVNVHY